MSVEKTKFSSKNSSISKDLSFFAILRQQLEVKKRKAVAELVSGVFETFIVENNPPENLIAAPSKVFRVEPEILEEIKT